MFKCSFVKEDQGFIFKISRIINNISGLGQRFSTNENGSVVIMFGLGVTLLFGIGAAAVDLGRQQLTAVKLQQATDAAATSAGSLTHSDGSALSPTEVSDAGNRYFLLNYQPAIGETPPTPTTTPGAGAITVSSTAVSTTTSFVSNFGRSTLNSQESSTVNTSSNGADFDLLMIVDETGSESFPFENGTRMSAEKPALYALVNSVLPPGSSNPNVRMGFIGFSGHITNKWGFSNSNQDAVSVVDALKPDDTNYDHIGMLAAADMMNGGTPGTKNESIYKLNGDPQAIAANTAAPTPRTMRTNPSDVHGLSPLKYAIFISDGDIMAEPTDDRPGCDRSTGAACAYEDPTPLVHKHCPGRTLDGDYQATACVDAYVDACTTLKNTGGQDNVHVMTISYVMGPTTRQGQALMTCASDTIPGSATSTLNSTIKPNPNKDFFIAPDSATLSTVLSNVSVQVKSLRIVK